MELHACDLKLASHFKIECKVRVLKKLVGRERVEQYEEFHNLCCILSITVIKSM